MYVFVNAHYICIWSVTCAGVPSLTADVIWIESRSPILWTTERNRSLHVPVPPVWKSIIMIFQSHHVLFCVILFWGWVGWKGIKPKYYLNCLLKLINNSLIIWTFFFTWGFDNWEFCDNKSRKGKSLVKGFLITRDLVNQIILRSILRHTLGYIIRPLRYILSCKSKLS